MIMVTESGQPETEIDQVTVQEVTRREGDGVTNTLGHKAMAVEKNPTSRASTDEASPSTAESACL